MLRPGNAGSNTAADHIAVIGAAIAQIPASTAARCCSPATAPGRPTPWWSTSPRSMPAPDTRSITQPGSTSTSGSALRCPGCPTSAWTPALDADGTPRPDAQVAELTGLLRHSAGGDRLAGWPADMRILIRRENPHPGAQLSLFEQHEGKRYQVTATSTPRGQVQFLEARHRTQARVEDSIRCAKSTGLGHLPSRDYRSIPPGARPPPSPVTCWPGCGSSPSTATWQKPSPKPCATGSCTPPGGSSKASAAGT